MVNLVKILTEHVLQGGNSEIKQKLKLHKLSLSSLTCAIPLMWREARRLQCISALIEFRTEHDSSITSARLAALVERHLTHNMKEASASHE